MVQSKLATGPLSIALFSISYCQQPRTQHPLTSIHKSKFHPIHYSPQMATLTPSLGPQGIYTYSSVYPQKDGPQEEIHAASGPFGHKFWDPKYSKHGLERKGSGSKWAYPIGPTDSLPHGRGTKQGSLKHRARNRISLEPSNIMFVNMDSSNTGTHFIIICEIVHESFMYFSTNNGTVTMCLLISYTISCSKYSCPKSIIWI